VGKGRHAICHVGIRREVDLRPEYMGGKFISLVGNQSVRKGCEVKMLGIWYVFRGGNREGKRNGQGGSGVVFGGCQRKGGRVFSL